MPRCFAVVSFAAIMLQTLPASTRAAESSDLKLRGTIKPVACSVELSEHGVTDFGIILSRDVPENDFKSVIPLPVLLTLTCSDPVRLSISASDNRSGTAAPGLGKFMDKNHRTDADVFGVGMVDGKYVGGYLIYRNKEGTGDGVLADMITSNDGGKTWVPGKPVDDGMNGLSHADRQHGWAAPGTLFPGQFRTITQVYFVHPGINKRSLLPPLVDDIPIDGSATISIHYP
ncbi:DUF1120 domain-containing protein [Cupriavidus agavae]|uniref:Uncharacterized protein DUF1120 n=1 Tax=Cupriavidus agavae TaxID=1001822 RepID=A0A4V2FI66_9BURK|nr:DUF1120 domain-containing protein [Cupriavidus agavae]RZT42709.1 uncharacterized protein DUF1120 [Cupriavidus agavae]